MTVVNAIRSTPAAPAVARRCHTAFFATRWLDGKTVVIEVEGEVDAVNADALRDYAMSVLPDADRVVLDFSKVRFFGIAGVSALQTLRVAGTTAGTEWVMVVSPAVARVLRICDPAGVMVAVGTLAAGIAVLDGDSRPALQLVAR